MEAFKERSRTETAVTYELELPSAEAATGAVRILNRNGKRLEVKVPPRIAPSQTIRLRNALRVTDGHDGDILIRVLLSDDSDAGKVVVVSDATFEAEVLNSRMPVVVDFWAPWCGPCRALSPIVERLAVEYAGRVKFRKLNVDQNPLASQKYQVMSVPTVLVFKSGRIAGMSVGLVSDSELRSRINAALPPA